MGGGEGKLVVGGCGWMGGMGWDRVGGLGSLRVEIAMGGLIDGCKILFVARRYS